MMGNSRFFVRSGLREMKRSRMCEDSHLGQWDHVAHLERSYVEWTFAMLAFGVVCASLFLLLVVESCFQFLGLIVLLVSPSEHWLMGCSSL